MTSNLWQGLNCADLTGQTGIAKPLIRGGRHDEEDGRHRQREVIEFGSGVRKINTDGQQN